MFPDLLEPLNLRPALAQRSPSTQLFFAQDLANSLVYSQERLDFLLTDLETALAISCYARDERYVLLRLLDDSIELCVRFIAREEPQHDLRSLTRPLEFPSSPWIAS